MIEKNPFTVLGFTPSAFHGLTDTQILILVKVQFRTLVTFHHPDQGGKVERFREIQEAMEKLAENHEFTFWKKSFLRKRKDQIAELKQAGGQARAVLREAQEALADYWLAYLRGAEVFQRPSLGLEEPILSRFGFGGFSVFNPPSVSIIMLDQLTELMRKQAVSARKEAGDLLALPQDLVNADCFELRISADGDGVMTRQRLTKTYFDPRERWRPAVRNELIEFREAPSPKKSYYWKPEGKSEPVSGTLIGSFPKQILSDKGVQDTGQVHGLISQDVGSADYAALERGYSLDEFAPYLRFVRPRVMSGHLVIIAVGDDERSIRFRILGYARLILPLEEKKPHQ